MEKKVKVLWIDDDTGAVASAVEYLRNTFPDIEIKGARSITAALEYLEKNTPDILLTDILLPAHIRESDGFNTKVHNLIDMIEEKNPKCIKAIVTGADKIPKFNGAKVIEKPYGADDIVNFVKNARNLVLKNQVKPQPKLSPETIKETALSHRAIIAKQFGFKRPLTVKEARRQIAAEIQAGPGYGDKRLMKYLFPTKTVGKIPKPRVK